MGDITTVNTEVIVNTANFRLLGGGGVDGAIHKRGGPTILTQCKTLRETKYPDGLPCGEATITEAGNLKAKYVIHTVGPRYKFDDKPAELLGQCYKNSLLLADKYKCKSIAFPSISTGVYAYPKEEAAKIAYETIYKTMQQCDFIEDVVLVFYTNKEAEIMKDLI